MLDSEIQLYETRIRQFVDRLCSYFYQDRVSMDVGIYRCHEPVAPERCRDLEYTPISIGEVWGETWQQAWFVVTGQIPERMSGETVVALIDVGGEGLVLDEKGTPISAVSVQSIFDQTFKRDRIRLFEPAQGGETVTLYIEATATQIFGLSQQQDPAADDPHRHGYHQAKCSYLSLAVFREDIWHLHLDASLLFDQMQALPPKSVRRARILRDLNRAIDLFRETLDGVTASRECLKSVLYAPSGPSDLTTSAVGHAHIDTAWLWPVGETIKKCARTFVTQLDLLERYPDYIFGASMPQHYQFLKTHYPGLYERIQRKVSEGRWEVQGGMWVEADCNLISGESMVRQLLHGKRFFRKEFGVDVKTLWLPDVFGYSAALPQILKKSGIETMVTQKLSWNQFNKFPHNTFIWQGIDNSDIIVHFPPEDCYTTSLKPSGLKYARENFEERDRLDEFLTLYGIGDGGGGPTEEMIEYGHRQLDLESSPRVRFSTAQAFLDRLVEQRHLLKRWVGELYFELHRGTLTTQARIKKLNRVFEQGMRTLEILFSTLDVDHYPSETLDAMWKQVLLHQFHDIIPGSSIHQVYQDTWKAFSRLETERNKLFTVFQDHVIQNSNDHLVLINTLSHSIRQMVELPDSWIGYRVATEAGEHCVTQYQSETLSAEVEMTPFSVLTLVRGERQDQDESGPPTSGPVLENDLIRYEFSPDSGLLLDIWDKQAQRQVLDSPAGNALTLYEDRPTNWDAWEIEIYYENQVLEQATLQSWEWIERGPVRSILRFHYSLSSSHIRQDVVLTSHNKRLDFVTYVNWQEHHRMLRTSFPVTVRAQEASFEIQYGTIKRPTHRNTSWDMARFEVVGHRFADLSEADYGVAVLNDCKYGYKVLGSVIDLNLLRAPTYPDPDADRGEHEFTYSLLPHAGALEQSTVYSEAARLNQNLVCFQGRLKQNTSFPCRPDSENVVLEVMKRAEEGSDWIVRLYEPRGHRADVRLNLLHDDMRVWETNLIEENNAELEVSDSAVLLSFTPFEIRTFRIKRG